MTILACGGDACIAGVSRDCGDSVFRLEGGATRSQTRRDTNFAIPGYSLFCHDTTASDKNKVFSVCGHSCGQSCFCAAFCNRGKSCKRRCRKALRRFTLPCPGYRHGTPKAGALPTALHPDSIVSAPYSEEPRRLMVPVTGLEPVRCRQRWILSPLRLPIPSHRHNMVIIS